MPGLFCVCDGGGESTAYCQFRVGEASFHGTPDLTNWGLGRPEIDFQGFGRGGCGLRRIVQK